MTKIKLYCNYCPEIYPDFKTLVDHYKDKHANKLNRYLVENRAEKARAIINAPSAQEACQSLGWQIGDCFIKELR